MTRSKDEINTFWKHLLTEHSKYHIDVGQTFNGIIDDTWIRDPTKTTIIAAPSETPIGYKLRAQQTTQTILYRGDHGKFYCEILCEIRFTKDPEVELF
jgi:hypothetical protein